MIFHHAYHFSVPFSCLSKSDVVLVPFIVWISPAIIRDSRRPSRSQRIPIVRIGTEALVKLTVDAELFVIELYAEPRSSRHRDGAVFVLELATGDDVVLEVMIVRVGGERKIRNNCAAV